MHFQETYANALMRPAIEKIVSIEWVADLSANMQIAMTRCRAAGQTPEFVGVNAFLSDALPDVVASRLDEALARNPVDAVLVSTTPEVHRAYATWAMSRQLDVLMDKPITARRNAAFDEAEALKILSDWVELNKLSKNSGRLLMINTHRRFHPAYCEVTKLLKQVADTFGFGVTAISSFNSDGQWRFPDELLDITYHGFDTGNGVLSHFGYHYLDLAALWYREGTPAEYRADRALITSSLLLAKDYARWFDPVMVNSLLERSEQPVPTWSHHLEERLVMCGEIDAYGSIELVEPSGQRAHINIQMLHSGFSQRAWTIPAANLYKENGRVRWESHLIHQGPLHAIEIRSFQALQPSRHDPSEGLPRWELGGADHLEINIFRNKLIGGAPLESINVRELLREIPQHDVVHEDIKAKVLQLFLGIVAHRRKMLDRLDAPAAWKSDVQDIYVVGGERHASLITSHQPPVAFMAGMYASYARGRQGTKLRPAMEMELEW